MKNKILLATLIALPFQALASPPQCETNFSKEGSFFSGQTYKTWAMLNGTKPSKAYKGAYLYTVKDGWKITSSDKEMGIISAAQDVSYGKGKAAPLNIVVEESGPSGSKMSLTYSTSGGVYSPEDAIMKHFCVTIAAAKSNLTRR